MINSEKKVFALMGSPRQKQNTDLLLDSFLNGIDSYQNIKIKKTILRDKKIHLCLACGHCEKNGECIFHDDMDEIYYEFENSDIIIIASPIYFNTVTSYVKVVVDRCQRYWSKKYVLNNRENNKRPKKGFFVGVGGSEFRQGHFSSCISVMDLFFKAIDAKYIGDYLVSNTDNKPVWERDEIIEEINKIGKNVFDVSQFCIYR